MSVSISVVHLVLLGLVATQAADQMGVVSNTIQPVVKLKAHQCPCGTVCYVDLYLSDGAFGVSNGSTAHNTGQQ